MADTLFLERFTNRPIPKWTKVTKTFTDFSAAATNRQISILTLPISGYIHDVKIIPTTAFSGGLIGTYTISVGKAGATTRYSIPTNVFTGNTTVTDIHTPLVGLESISATEAITATALTTVANLDQATAGSVDIHLLVSILP